MLADAASDIGFSQFVIGVGKYFLCFIYFNKLTQMEIGGAVRYARSLLHGVSHDSNSEILAQFSN